MPLSRLAPDPLDAIAPVMALRLLSRGVSGGRTVDPDRLVPVLREFLFEHPGAREVSVLLADYELRELRLLSPGDGGLVRPGN